jgi:hypothetical protein
LISLIFLFLTVGPAVHLQPSAKLQLLYEKETENQYAKISTISLAFATDFRPINTPKPPLFYSPKIPNFCAARLRKFLAGVRAAAAIAELRRLMLPSSQTS